MCRGAQQTLNVFACLKYCFYLAFFMLLEVVEGGDTFEFCAVLVVTIDWKKPYHP